MKVVLELSETEYAELCRKAAADRRSPEQMAEWLVTKGEKVVPWPYPVYPAQPQPWYQPSIISRDTTDVPLPGNQWRVPCAGGNLNTLPDRRGENIC